MKYLLIVFTLLAIVSCKYSDRTPRRVDTFEYNKHQYLRFEFDGRSHIVHNPDCKYCFEKFD